MNKHIQRNRIWKISLVIFLFIALLAAARFAWVQTFADEEKANIVNGELDLRTHNKAKKEILALDGKWKFYPSTLLMEEDATTSKMIQVPGDWSPYVDYEGSEDSYGYGSYRLRIQVDPTDTSTYSIRVPSVRSASALYVNGKKVGGSGTVGKNKATYKAENLPYSAYFSAEDGEIDIVLQVANYRDPRNSGLVRSLKFSTDKNLTKQTTISTGLQQMMLVVLLIHSFYAMILYFLGHRDKRLIYFALFSASYMFMLGLGLEEKFLHVWFGIDYTIAFRLSTILLVAIGYFLFKAVQDYFRPSWKKVLVLYEGACIVSFISIIVLPMHTFLGMQSIYFGLTLFSFVISLYVIINESLKQPKRNMLLLLALTAFFSNGLWTYILMFAGVKEMYYPFDLILAVICLAAFWFQYYFDVHNKAERLSLKLQEADKIKDAFLASTSHELRNPLHAMLNISSGVLEREETVLKDESVKDLQTVLSVGRRMTAMVNDLLDVMALKESTPRLNKHTISVQSVTGGVFDMLDFLTEGKNIRLVNKLPEDFPAVYADENRVVQVLFNLVHNGIKYTNDGVVAVSGYVEGDRGYIVVTDTGIGMEEDALATIFDRYEQAQINSGLTEGGFGLGLSISKQLAELHGGHLEVKSEVGKGSTFTFSLPLSTEKQPLTEDVPPYMQEYKRPVRGVPEKADDKQLVPTFSKTSPRIDRPRILVVDDDPINLQVVQSVLSVEEYDMTTVLSGEEALDVLNTQEWDLVISDVMMPHMSGYQLTRHIRKRFTITELPVLLLTARVQLHDIEQGFLSGANDYVAKPVDALELKSRVHALTTVRRSMREHLRMEAAWLQAQIQPHFLFNALNTIIALSEIDPKRMQHVLEAFSDLLRGKFNFQNLDDFIPIQDEIELLRNYLYIEKARFGNRLHVQWDLDDLQGVHIPPLTIQPLVENAIHHGIMKEIEGGTLLIQIKKKDGGVQIRIQDDGVGMEEDIRKRLLERHVEGQTGVGLLNTHLRLKRQFDSGLHISSTLGEGTTITFTIPHIDE